MPESDWPKPGEEDSHPWAPRFTVSGGSVYVRSRVHDDTYQDLMLGGVANVCEAMARFLEQVRRDNADNAAGRGETLTPQGSGHEEIADQNHEIDPTPDPSI
jgi:hypothetical protein